MQGESLYYIFLDLTIDIKYITRYEYVSQDKNSTRISETYYIFDYNIIVSLLN